jgi:hypothetical protein
VVNEIIGEYLELNQTVEISPEYKETIETMLQTTAPSIRTSVFAHEDVFQPIDLLLDFLNIASEKTIQNEHKHGENKYANVQTDLASCLQLRERTHPFAKLVSPNKKYIEEIIMTSEPAVEYLVSAAHVEHYRLFRRTKRKQSESLDSNNENVVDIARQDLNIVTLL